MDMNTALDLEVRQRCPDAAVAYGYRDANSFFLRIRAAFPGKAR